MARKIGQIICRGSSTWLVRIYVGRNLETRKRRDIGKFIHGGLRSVQAHLNRMLAERDLGRNIYSSRQTAGQYLDHWLGEGKRKDCDRNIDEKYPSPIVIVGNPSAECWANDGSDAKMSSAIAI